MQAFDNKEELDAYLRSIDESLIIRTDHGIYTNLCGHDPVTVAWLIASDYEVINDTDMVSVTELVNPTIISVLRRRHRKETVMDVTDLTNIAVGRSIHDNMVLRSPERQPLQEHKLTHKLSNGMTLRGTADLWVPPGKIIDYKATNVYKVQKKDFDDYRYQVNSYAWLYKKSLGMDTQEGEIVAILDGWRWRDAVADSNYPQNKTHRIPIAIMSMDEIEVWLEKRAAQFKFALDLPDDELIPCSKEERWEKPRHWRVVKRGNKRAKKNFYEDRGESITDAEQYAAAQGADFEVFEVDGERTRCERYCACRPWCPLY